MSEYVRPEYTPLFREVQETIAGYLNADPQISAKHIEFFPEAKLDIDFEVKKALGQQGIVGVVNTLKGTFAGHDGCTNAWQIEAEVDVIENPPVRRAQLKKMGLSTGTVSDILDWIQESLGGPSSPTFAKFNPVSQEIGQNNGLVVGRSIMRTLVLADTSAVISTENQWVCPYALQQDLSALAAQVEGIEYDISGKADISDLANYLPISGGTMFGTIGFSPDSDWEHDLGYKLIQLNPTGEDWQALFGVNDDNGQPYVAHNGSETGSGAYHQYSWKLWFPDENGTLATQEWAQSEISGKVDASYLSAYLPLSGGETTGTVTVPQLSASSSVVVGDPNIGSLGPNETGQHLSGVVITDGGVLDLQGKWITDNTWHKVSIDPTGRIIQFRFEGLPL